MVHIQATTNTRKLWQLCLKIFILEGLVSLDQRPMRRVAHGESEAKRVFAEVVGGAVVAKKASDEAEGTSSRLKLGIDIVVAVGLGKLGRSIENQAKLDAGENQNVDNRAVAPLVDGVESWCSA